MNINLRSNASNCVILCNTIILARKLGFTPTFFQQPTKFGGDSYRIVFYKTDSVRFRDEFNVINPYHQERLKA